MTIAIGVGAARCSAALAHRRLGASEPCEPGLVPPRALPPEVPTLPRDALPVSAEVPMVRAGRRACGRTSDRLAGSVALNRACPEHGIIWIMGEPL
jgi:hypothetical protein